MSAIPWYITALGAALVWGLHYPLIDTALRKLSLVTVVILTCLPLLVLVPLYRQTLRVDWSTFLAMTPGERWPVLLLPLTSLAATVLLFLSIEGRNATLASLIEITYPLFVALFAFVLFGERSLSWPVGLGAMLVFAGVGLIIYTNP